MAGLDTYGAFIPTILPWIPPGIPPLAALRLRRAERRERKDRIRVNL